MTYQLWAIRERAGDETLLHFTIAQTRQDSWNALFKLNSFRDDTRAQRRARRKFKAIKVEIREVIKGAGKEKTEPHCISIEALQRGKR